MLEHSSHRRECADAKDQARTSTRAWRRGTATKTKICRGGARTRPAVAAGPAGGQATTAACLSRAPDNASLHTHAREIRAHAAAAFVCLRWPAFVAPALHRARVKLAGRAHSTVRSARVPLQRCACESRACLVARRKTRRRVPAGAEATRQIRAAGVRRPLRRERLPPATQAHQPVRILQHEDAAIAAVHLLRDVRGSESRPLRCVQLGRALVLRLVGYVLREVVLRAVRDCVLARRSRGRLEAHGRAPCTSGPRHPGLDFHAAEPWG